MRNFTLKAIKIFGINYEVVSTPETTQQDDGTILVVSRVRVTLGDRVITEASGCSTGETRANGHRAYNDAVAIAGTRATKRGVEAIVGAPIIEMIIKSVFGPPPVPSVDNRAIIDGLKIELTNAVRSGALEKTEARRYYDSLRPVADNTARILEIQAEILELINTRTSASDAAAT